MFYEGINAKVFRRTIAFAIAVVVTSRSSSLDYTISVHACAERNVCKIVVSILKHPQFSTNPSQTLLHVYKLAHLPLPTPSPHLQDPPQPLAKHFAQMRYRCKYQASSFGRYILDIYLYHLSTCIYVSVHESSGAS